MSGDRNNLPVYRPPIESKIFITAAECPYLYVEQDPNRGSSQYLTFKVTSSYRIRSDTGTAYRDVCMHSSHEECQYALYRLLDSADEREEVVAEILFGLNITFSTYSTLHWKELRESSYQDVEQFNSVVTRISEVVARVARDAAVAGRNRAEIIIMVDRRSVFAQDEFERLASSVGYVINDDYEDEDEDDDDDDDSVFNWAVERSLLESAESLLPADASAVEGLEKLTYDVGIGGDDDESKLLMRCVICMEEVMSGTQLTRMPCSHLYHGDCIKQWLQRRNSCPLCRFSLPSSKL